MIKLTKLYLAFLFTLNINSQNTENQLSFLDKDNNITEYSFQGVFFDKTLYENNKIMKKDKKNIKHALKSQYHINEKYEKLYILDSIEIEKITFYCKHEKKGGVFYNYFHKNGKIESLTVGAYRDKAQLKKLDSLAIKIYSKTINNANEIKIVDDSLNFDDLKFKIDRSFFEEKRLGLTSFKTTGGYIYNISLHDDENNAKKHIEENLIKYNENDDRNKFIVTVNEVDFIVNNFFHSHLVKKKGEKHPIPTYTNYIFSYFKYKGLFITINCRKGYIYDRKKLTIPQEFIKLLEQVYNKNKAEDEN